jgi:hypothetical protein
MVEETDEDLEEALELGRREIERDEKLAIEYLGCKEIEFQGVREFEYVEAGSAREVECLAALSRLLRGDRPLSGLIRWRLASLFDPDSPTETRQLFMRRPTGGKDEPSHIRDVEIARDLAADVKAGRKLDSAVRAAEQRYGVSHATVMRAWRDHNKVWLDRNDQPLN